MVNQFEQFTPAAAVPATDDLSSVRSQQYSSDATAASGQTDTANSHLPDVSVGGEFEFVSAISDGPGRVVDNSLNGQNPHREPAELGNAHHTLELIASNNFQNPDNSISAAGLESIRAAVAEAGNLKYTLNPFQTYEARAQQVEKYINQFVDFPISIRVDRDKGNAATAVGSRPFIIVNERSRIPLNR